MEKKMNENKKRFIRLPKEKIDAIINDMVEIELMEHENRQTGEKTSNFLLVREALTRIGVLKNNKLYQSVHILQKKGKYYLCHFKQLFALDGLETSFNETDRKRLYKITRLLQKWGMVKIVNQNLAEKIEKIENNPNDNVFVHVVPIEKIRNGEITRVKKYDL